SDLTWVHPRFKRKFLTVKYHTREASFKPYTALFNFQSFPSVLPASFGGFKNTSLSNEVPCKNAAFMSIALLCQECVARIQKKIFINGLLAVGESTLTSESDRFSSNPLATSLAFGL
ncbi:unnamed protein product, partial [Meganyctiphanes norvegica]